jgi:hypothetical protein
MGMTPGLDARHMSMVVVDVERFGDAARTDADRLVVRSTMYRALKRSFTGSGIPWQDCEISDQGDGVLALVPPTVSKNRLVVGLPERLVRELDMHNKNCPPAARIRLRMAVDAAEIHRDPHGHTGNGLNYAFRMLDATAVRTALARSSGDLVLVASEYFYRQVIRQDPAAAPDTYRRLAFETKETSDVAWLRLPGDDGTTALAVARTAAKRREGVDRLREVLSGSPSLRTALSVLVDALLAVPVVAHENGRRLLLDQLRPQLANAVPYSPQARLHVFSLLRTCMDYEHGLDELLTVVRQLEGDSTPARQLDDTIAELLSQLPD